MAHFFGYLQGSRGSVTRLGTRKSGLKTIAASWQGAVQAYLYNKDGVVHAEVRLIPWHGHGTTKIIYDGPVEGEQP